MLANLTLIIDELINQLAGAPRPQAPLVAFNPQSPGETATRAFARMAADPSNQANRIRTYIGRYGFDGAEGFRGASIREPWRGIAVEDLEAVIAVADALQVAPAQVLAVWISEGKYLHERLLKGGTLSVQVDEAIAVADPVRVRAYARSAMLFLAFGSDYLTDYVPRGAPGGDNLIRGPEGNHDARFLRGLDDFRSVGVQGLGAMSNNQIVGYFRDPGGAMRLSIASSGSPRRAVTVSLRPNSLASWLYLQGALFEVFRNQAEQRFAAAYEAVDLSERPWVVYVSWNGGPGTFNSFFSGGSSAEDAIARRFGATDRQPDPLPEDQINRYYGRGAYSGAGQSVAALANAVVVRYLMETVEPWFA